MIPPLVLDTKERNEASLSCLLLYLQVFSNSDNFFRWPALKGGFDSHYHLSQLKTFASLSGSVLGQFGWGFEQSGLVKGVPAHGRGYGARQSLRYLPTVILSSVCLWTRTKAKCMYQRRHRAHALLKMHMLWTMTSVSAHSTVLALNCPW